MIGQVIGYPGAMPNVYLKITAKCLFMKRINLSEKVTKPKNGQTVLTFFKYCNLSNIGSDHKNHKIYI